MELQKIIRRDQFSVYEKLVRCFYSFASGNRMDTKANVAKDEFDNVIGVVPLYLKRLQSCLPFTPVTGPRILLRNSTWKDKVFDVMVSALKDLTNKLQVSSMHVTFPTESEWNGMKEKGFLQRIGMQYHWKNRNYKDFDEFLMDLKQSKRKNIRQERKKVSC